MCPGQDGSASAAVPVPFAAGEDLLRVRLSVLDAFALVSLEGEIDLGSAPRVLEAVELCLAHGASGISIDLSAVTFCDCAGLNAFDRARAAAEAAGGTVHLLDPSPPVARLFSILDPGGSSVDGVSPRP